MVKSVYARRVAKQSTLGLLEAVVPLTDMLRAHINAIYKYKGNKANLNTMQLIATAKELADNNQKLYDAAVRVVDEVGKVETRDTG